MGFSFIPPTQNTLCLWVGTRLCRRPPPRAFTWVSPVDADSSSHWAVMFPGRDWIKPGEDLKKKNCRKREITRRSASQQVEETSREPDLCGWSKSAFKSSLKFRYSFFSVCFPSLPLCNKLEDPQRLSLRLEHVFQVRISFALLRLSCYFVRSQQKIFHLQIG